MKKIFLAIIFCLLMSTIATAESTWVLWVRNTLNGFKWERFDAFPSYEKCKERQWKGCTKLLRPIPSVTTLNGCPNSITMFYSNGDILEYDWICLPDTIDPRK